MIKKRNASFLEEINSNNAVQKFQELLRENLYKRHKAIFDSGDPSMIAVMEMYYFFNLFFQVGEYDTLSEETQVAVEQFFDAFKEILESHGLLDQFCRYPYGH